VAQFDRNTWHGPTEISTNKEYPSTISYNTTVSVDDLINEISKLILFNVNEEKILPNEICIVAPQWIHLASVPSN